MSGKKLILIVEDDQRLGEAFQCLLEEFYETEIVHYLEEAKQRVTRLPLPDCILLDLLLPNGAGMTLVNDLDKHTPSTPIIVVSGMDVTEKAVKAAGGQALLFKPVMSQTLLDKVGEVIDQWADGSLRRLEFSMAALDAEMSRAVSITKDKPNAST